MITDQAVVFDALGVRGWLVEATCFVLLAFNLQYSAFFIPTVHAKHAADKMTLNCFPDFVL